MDTDPQPLKKTSANISPLYRWSRVFFIKFRVQGCAIRPFLPWRIPRAGYVTTLPESWKAAVCVQKRWGQGGWSLGVLKLETEQTGKMEMRDQNELITNSKRHRHAGEKERLCFNACGYPWQMPVVVYTQAHILPHTTHTQASKLSEKGVARSQNPNAGVKVNLFL